MVYGSFDVLRVEDIELFKKAKTVGNYLVVVLVGDELENCSWGEIHRQVVLESIRYVDEVFIINADSDLKEVIQKNELGIFVTQKDKTNSIEYFNEFCQVVYV